jgi:hypothetical protein
VTLFDFLSLKYDVIVPSKSTKQKKIVLILLFFAGILKFNDEKSRNRIQDPDPDPPVRGMDPRIRIHPKMSWIRNTAFSARVSSDFAKGNYVTTGFTLLLPTFTFPLPQDEHLNVEEWAARLRQWQEQEAAKERRRLEAEDLRRKQQEELRRRQAEEEERIRQEELRYQEEEEEEEEDYDGEEEEYQEEDYQEEDNYQEGEEYERNEDYGRGEEYGEGEDVNMEEKDEAPELDGEYEGEFLKLFYERA